MTRSTLLNAYFGQFGGQYVPEKLLPVLDELEAAYVHASQDREFLEELDQLRENYLGRPTPITECANLPLTTPSSEDSVRVRIFLKREDLVHGGAHKGNQVLAQGLLARRLGKTRLIAETGAGQHGTATAMIAALLGMECTIYMGAKDVARQQPNVLRMRMMGATVVPVVGSEGSMSNAIDTALNDWVENVETTHYLLGSACGPHPFPTLVKGFQAVISQESRAQMLDRIGRLPDMVIAAVGGGSNAIGAFAHYLTDEPGNDDVQLVGVEPAGKGLDSGKHGAPLARGKVGVLHGSKSYVLLGESGDVTESYSISAGLDYPGVGPEHAYLMETGRARYVGITDAEALQAFRMLCRYEGILPALESAHALAYAFKLADSINDGNLDEALGADTARRARQTGEVALLVNLSGRGDKDVEYVHNVIGDLVYDDPMTTHVTELQVSEVLADMTAQSNAREGL
ncbi:tryptophan synthase subunit beta [Arcanobacterium pinnipediorum]|uniref:Tryptophan synthase beta chain n=1 Tax=Arcanobacterium pinnipediorum TaxID=1503041 RepID=A0ABY5AIC1_9ACTO|nr:tryptophan synthase subunit beta [Arcanobacterium pinnipediorum]USR79602.1 tryptophan synthase subunit beta [Arcanobacterium pinnipediorum]